MTLTEAQDLLRPYLGQDLYNIGTLIEDKSSYCYNFYRLPNGTIVLLDSNDDSFSDVAVIDGDIDTGTRIYVGGQQDFPSYGFMLGNFS